MIQYFFNKLLNYTINNVYFCCKNWFSVDDQDVSYRSSKVNGNSSGEGRNADMMPSSDALEAQRLQKMYNMFRRHASGASSDSPLGTRSPQHQRLDNWLGELESKQRIEKK